jgi:putative endonuclease
MPQREYNFFVYILASRSRQLYVGVTNSLERRMKEHCAALPGSYTARYSINRLVYFEHRDYVLNAIARETEWKCWTRKQKVSLIESVNPTWEDLRWIGASRFGFSGERWRRPRQQQIPCGNDNKGSPDVSQEQRQKQHLSGTLQGSLYRYHGMLTTTIR